jgi:hypothetical protein
MKMIIAKLSKAAIISLLLFFISMLFGSSSLYKFEFGTIQNVLILLSMVLFAVIMILQVYRFYISFYLRDEAEENLLP